MLNIKQRLFEHSVLARPDSINLFNFTEGIIHMHVICITNKIAHIFVHGEIYDIVY